MKKNIVIGIIVVALLGIGIMLFLSSGGARQIKNSVSNMHGSLMSIPGMHHGQ
jgi:hypothetical protein